MQRNEQDKVNSFEGNRKIPGSAKYLLLRNLAFRTQHNSRVQRRGDSRDTGSR